MVDSIGYTVYHAWSRTAWRVVSVLLSHHGGLCAVMGGYVYRGARYPALDGIYLYADFCTGRIFGLVAAEAVPGQPSTTRQVGSLNSLVSAFGEDEFGNVYVLGYQSGVAYQVTNA